MVHTSSILAEPEAKTCLNVINVKPLATDALIDFDFENWVNGRGLKYLTMLRPLSI